MEKTMSVEEKIRRAEQIYERRRNGNTSTESIKEKKEDKKDIKLLRKLIIQVLVCTLIYLIVYVIQNNNYIFSEDFIKKANEILSYDTNFVQIYNNIKDQIFSLFNINTNQDNKNQQTDLSNNQEATEQAQEEQVNEEQGIGGAPSNEEIATPIEPVEEKQISQEEQDIIDTKNTTTFIKPIEGTISSVYGHRDPTTATVPKNHTGTDIAAVTGTKIKSATDGEVVLASEEGDYGKHLKIQIGEVSIIYAHCNNLYVKQGDIVKQGQEIAEVGSTGNSTGPHLHFEIRISERTVDPQKILDL